MRESLEVTEAQQAILEHTPVLDPETVAVRDALGRVLASPVEWSRADGDYVHQCPTNAIHVSVLEGTERRSTLEMPILEE